MPLNVHFVKGAGYKSSLALNFSQLKGSVENGASEASRWAQGILSEAHVGDTTIRSLVRNPFG